MKPAFPLARLCLAVAVSFLINQKSTAQDLGEGLVAYWPLDVVEGDKTPDLVNGYNLAPYVGAAHTLTNKDAVTLVAGHKGKAASFDNANQILLGYVASAGDDLPINKHPAITVAYWVKGAAAQNDRRMFSEGNINSNNPLFNIGSNTGGGMVDLFFRQQPSAAELAAGYGDFGGGAHMLSVEGIAFDDGWHLVTFVQQADGTRTLYVDGVADSLAIPAKPAGNWNVNATSVGGILRSTAGAWVTASIDDVALWKRALTPEEITKFKDEGLDSVFPPLRNGLVAYWPMDSVEGDKVPERVNGYNLTPYVGASHTLTNGSAVALIDGHKGKAVSFDNANQVLLGYIAGANDQLPINKYPAITVNFWLRGAPAQNDRRVFSEGNINSNNPLFNIGSNTGGGMIDLFFRQQPSAAELAAGYGDFGGGAHMLTADDPTKPFDNSWHMVTLVQQEDGSRTIYIDGTADSLAIPPKPAGNWNVNATSIGGILRSTAGAWVTAEIDEVALWKRALTTDEISEVQTNGLNSVFPPVAEGLVSHWPLDTVQGGKSPDLVGGYDLSPYVGASHTLTTGDAIALVVGHKGSAVSFDNANQVLLGYIAGPNDDLPINKHSALTVSFWVKGAAAQNDRRLFSEGNINSNNPLFNIGSNTGGGVIDLFFRQQPSATELAAGYGDFGGGSHMLSQGAAFDDTWHFVTFVQNEDGSRTFYIDGVADGLAIPSKPAGNWNVNATSVGGILRSTAGAWVTAQIDEVGAWKRALTAEEVNEVRTNGIPRTFRRKLPLQIRSFVADRPSVGVGETVQLKWEASEDATLSISPAIGDVTSISAFGVGNTNIVVNATTTYTLTASRGSESTNITFTVNAVPGVAAGWRLLDNFDFLNLGHIGAQGNWQNSLNSVSGAHRPANVLQADGNKILGFDAPKILAGLALNSLAIPEGKSNTLFFRFYIPASVDTASAVDGTFPDIDLLLGLTEKGLRDVQDFQGGGNGPSIHISRNSGAAGGPIDLLAVNGPAGSVGPAYSWLADTVNNAAGAGLETGVVYNVWVDIENRPFNIVDGVQTGGDYYTVYIQKEGSASRVKLFENYTSDRDGVAVDPVLGRAGATLTHLYMSVTDTIATQGTNTLRVDDLYLSSNGFLSTAPMAARSFNLDSEQLRISSATFAAAGAFTITWGAALGQTFTIQKRDSLSTGNWAPLATDFPTGGATGPTVSYTDNTASGGTSFYRILSP